MIRDLVVTPSVIRTPIHRIDTFSVVCQRITKPTVSELSLNVVLEDRESTCDFGFSFPLHSQTSISIVEVDCGGGFVINCVVHSVNRIPPTL
jgi:hypothetical protein